MNVTWTQDPDLSTWRAKTGRTELTVTRLALDSWRPALKRGRSRDQGPVQRDRPSAQRWCEREARRS